MRESIYTRISTDKDTEGSSKYQVRGCRDYSKREGLKVISSLIVKDAGVSGATHDNQSGLLELVTRIDEWEVHLCFYSCGLARNAEGASCLCPGLRAGRGLIRSRWI